ncbi:hypothetical protein TcG_10521 [Trypanosoma cruzi]|nr:hypothetical protein TcG_10521 [Trypanosoma cruzi]
MTALSRAPNPILGEMAGNIVAASWMDAELLLRVALWVIACCALCVGCGLWPYSVGHGIELEAVAVILSSSSSLVGDCWLCVCLRAGVELPARLRAVTVLFPPVVCFFRVCCTASYFFPLSSSPPVFLRGVAACSRAMLIVSAS